MATKKRSNGKQANKKDHEVITLRIRPQTKQKLLSHCQKRGKKEGTQVSFNQAIIDMIERAPA